MDNKVIELLKLAGKLRQFSDNDVVVLKTGPLAEILDLKSDIDSNNEKSNVVNLDDKRPKS